MLAGKIFLALCLVCSFQEEMAVDIFSCICLIFFPSPGVPKGKGLFGITLCVIYGLSVSFPEKEIVVDTDLEIRIKLSAS